MKIKKEKFRYIFVEEEKVDAGGREHGALTYTRRHIPAIAYMMAVAYMKDVAFMTDVACMTSYKMETDTTTCMQSQMIRKYAQNCSS